MITKKDIYFLEKSIQQAKLALDNGDQPFGSILISKDDEILFSDHNKVKDGDHTRHPEFELAKWAMNNMTIEERQSATVYTSSEHCPMCAAAHGWANLGKIVYASSSKQLLRWLKELNVPLSNVKPLAINEVIDNTIAIGPVEEFSEEIFSLHKAYYKKS